MELILLLGEREERVRVRRNSDLFEVTLGESVYRVDSLVTHMGRGADLMSLRLEDGRQHEVMVRRAHENKDSLYQISTGPMAATVEVLDPLTHLARQAHGDKQRRGLQQVTAYMPGKVVTLLVEEGAEVRVGQGVLVLEAMKMENEIQAETDGIVRHLLVKPGQAVEGGDPLFEIE